MLVRGLFVLLVLQLPSTLFGDNVKLLSLLDSAEVYRKSDLSKSHEFLDEGLSVLEDIPNEFLKCRFFSAKYLTFHREGNYSNCRAYLSRIKESSCFNEYDHFKYRYYYYRAILQRSKANIDSSLFFLENANKFVTEEDYDKRLQLHASFGASYYSKKDNKSAISHLFLAESLIKKVKKYNQIQHCNILHNLGAIFFDIGALVKAEKYLNQSLTISNSTPIQRIQNLISLGGLYVEMDSIHKAKDLYLQAINENDFNPYMKAYSNLGLATAFQAESSIQKAISTLEKTCKVFESYEDSDACAQCSYLLATLFLDQKKLAESKKWIDRHSEYVSQFKTKTNDNNNQYLQLKYQLLKSGGNSSSRKLDEYKAGLDSINDLKLKREILEFEKNKQIQQSVDSLFIMKAAVRKANKQLQIRNWLSSFALMFLFLGSYFLFRTRKKDIKIETVEESQNERLPIEKRPDVSILQKRITIEGDKKIITTIGEISSIRAKDGGIEIKMFDGTASFLWTSLTKYISHLPKDYFVRVSKFHIINMAQIEQIVDFDIKLKSGDIVKYSSAYQERFMEAYGRLK